MSDDEPIAYSSSDSVLEHGHFLLSEYDHDSADDECENEDDDEQNPGAVARVVDSKTSFCIKTVVVSVKMGELVNEKVDIIVNSTSKDLNLKHGKASSVLSEAAGPGMQRECNIKYKLGVKEGEVAVTGGGNLKCTMVYHGCLPKWNTPRCEKVHKDFVSTCLEELHKSKLKTIAFPAIGSGFLQFPLNVVARNMLSSIKDYISSHTTIAVEEVKIVIYPKDILTYEAFKREVKKIQHNEEEEAVQTKVISTVTSGNISVTLIEGKLTEQKADVLVNSVVKELNLDKGLLSKSILEDGGQSIQAECRLKYSSGIKHGELAITAGGNLQCEAIFHVAIPKFGQTGDGGLSSEKILMMTMKTCLEEADGQGFTSLVFPAFGTGLLQFPSNVTSRVMLQAINDFASAYPSTRLTDIRIVVYPSPGHSSITQAFEKETKGNITTTLDATPLPPRGSQKFCLAKYREELYPPPNWTHFHSKKSIKDWKMSGAGKDLGKLVSVTSLTKEKIAKFVVSTWEQAKVGHGKDAVGLMHISLEVTDVKRIENVDLFEKYGTFRSNLFNKAGREGIFPKLETIKGSKGPIRSADAVLETDVYGEINETYLFHGTKKDNLDAILGQGLDFRMAESAMFGKGVYFAESSTKADQYTDKKNERKTAEKQMLIVRVCMGEMWIQSSPHEYKKPPCAVKDCLKDECSHCDNDHYDSVVGDGSWLFREFVVYERHQTYPEYLVSYVRK